MAGRWPCRVPSAQAPPLRSCCPWLGHEGERPDARRAGSLGIRRHLLTPWATLASLRQAAGRSAGRPLARSATAQSRPRRGSAPERCPGCRTSPMPPKMATRLTSGCILLRPCKIRGRTKLSTSPVIRPQTTMRRAFSRASWVYRIAPASQTGESRPAGSRQRGMWRPRPKRRPVRRG